MMAAGEQARRRWWWAGGAAAILVAGAALVAATAGPGHAEDARDHDGWVNHVEYFVGGDEVIDEIRGQLLAELAEAEHRIDAAIAGLDDEEIEAALVDAADRGVRVRVVADEHLADSGQFDVLVDHDGIDVAFGDGELHYLPDPTLSPILESCNFDRRDHDDFIICTRAQDDQGGFIPWEELDRPPNNDNVIPRPSHYNVMSHTFFLIDETELWNISAPLTDEQPLWLAFRALSEEMANSFEREFRQMHGGVFSTTLSVYNGPLKSVTHQNPLRFTNRGHLRVRFNPQERLTKNIIDETYRARASVFVMTENLTNTDLINALIYKKEAGFDVRVLLGQGQAMNPTSLQEAVASLEPRVATEEMGRLPTMVIFDTERDRNGNDQARQVQVLSHDLMRAQPFEVIRRSPADRVRFYPSDTFADGVLWEILEAGRQTNPEIDPFLEAFNDQWSQAE